MSPNANPPARLGGKIREARTAAGFRSQRQFAYHLAEQLNHEPESVRRNLVRWESGRGAPSHRFLVAIARATEQPLDSFSVGDDDDEEGPAAAADPYVELVRVVRAIVRAENAAVRAEALVA